MIIKVGNDFCSKIEGKIAQKFDYSRDEKQKAFSIIESSPSGQSCVIGSFNKLTIFNYSAANKQWEEVAPKVFENFLELTAISWKKDGSRLLIGNMCGAAEMFDCCLKRTRYKRKFEFNYISSSQVIVKRLSSGSRIVLKSHYNYEIQKINIFQDQYLIASSPETLLIGDLVSCKLSEVSA
jgi:intraflagellar transport protein 172